MNKRGQSLVSGDVDFWYGVIWWGAFLVMGCYVIWLILSWG